MASFSLRAAAVAVACLSASPAVLAWGQTGHRITGAIAEHYLSPSAKLQIEDILAGETLAEASTYPDEMKSNPAEFWKKVASPYHYVTVPAGKVYADVGAPESGDAVTALAMFAKMVKDPKTTLEEKQLALRFIVHIIGDLHQPLHAGNGTDRGGNQAKVKFFGEESNLHSVWDSGLIDKQQLSYSEMANWLSAKITATQFRQWRNAEPTVWIAESTAIRDTIYPQSPEISWDYQYQNLPVLKQRLQQGGVRIAVYLNQLFK